MLTSRICLWSGLAVASVCRLSNSSFLLAFTALQTCTLIVSLAPFPKLSLASSLVCPCAFVASFATHHILSSCLRLAPAPGAYSLPPCDWLPLPVHTRSHHNAAQPRHQVPNPCINYVHQLCLSHIDHFAQSSCVGHPRSGRQPQQTLQCGNLFIYSSIYSALRQTRRTSRGGYALDLRNDWLMMTGRRRLLQHLRCHVTPQTAVSCHISARRSNAIATREACSPCAILRRLLAFQGHTTRPKL
eukprot:1180885-Prorocentrum_minimum.AAC.1